ncbi:MAG: T9SS type A sorting domain-containing protein [candidate division Zixibacteria bacterium]|nr:T9SS type A sorting domain-containing protein [candidate division Zixibacteria bacterium]
MRKVVLLTVVCILLWAVIAYSAPGHVIWDTTYGGGEDDGTTCVKQTSNGGYLITGYTYSFGAGGYDIYILRTDASGDTSWTRTFGDSAYDRGRCGIETDNGDFVFTGYVKQPPTDSSDIFLLKLNADGDSLWMKTYGGASSDDGLEVKQTFDGGYILCGDTRSISGDDDIYVIRIDSEGDTIWTFVYGDSLNDRSKSIIQTSDTCFVLTGYTNKSNLNDGDLIIIKLDQNGNTLWTKVYVGDKFKMGYSVIETDDNDLVIAGKYVDAAETHYVYLMRTEPDGDSSWARKYRGGLDDEGHSVQMTNNNGFFVTGQIYPFSDDAWDLYVLFTDSDGSIMYDTSYGESGYSYKGRSAHHTQDNNFIVTGMNDYSGSTDIYLLKIEGDPCLTCNALSQSNRVPNIDGTILWDLEIQNCGVATPVWAEIYPTVGDCASGTQYDFDIIRLAVSNLNANNSTTLYYWYRPGTVTGVIDAAINIDIGSAIDNYISNCCFEFIFAYEFGRPGNVINFGPGEWGERESEIILPTTTALMQNYPNPFNATTTITFDIVQNCDVNLAVYNLAGQKIETLVNGNLNSGHHNITWDASTYSSGVYFYKLTTSDRMFTKRMMLLK